MSQETLTTISVLVNEGTQFEHSLRMGTVNLSPEDERMQELIETGVFYENVKPLEACGETTVGASSTFVFRPATDEERQDWQKARLLDSAEDVYLLCYRFLPVRKSDLS